jgi:hypothetical protein
VTTTVVSREKETQNQVRSLWELDDDHAQERHEDEAVPRNGPDLPAPTTVVAPPSPAVAAPFVAPFVAPFAPFSAAPTADIPSPQETPFPSMDDTETPTIQETPISSMGDTEVPTIRISPLEQFLTETLTNDGSLQDPSTPQYAALTALQKSNPNLDPAVDQVEITQRYVLNTFYFALNGTSWVDIDTSLWTTAADVCTPWAGVACDKSTVITLDFNKKKLEGSLPSELKGLSTLCECS